MADADHTINMKCTIHIQLPAVLKGFPVQITFEDTAPAPAPAPSPDVPPDPGEGYELIDADAARANPKADYQVWYGPGHQCPRWDGRWDSVESCGFGDNVRYAFRAPIAAKPAPKWVACTAEEAEVNPKCSETFVDGKWRNCREYDCAYMPEWAYRTTAALPDWVRTTLPLLVAPVGETLTGTEIRFTGLLGVRELRRASVPVGTVLG